MITIENWRGQGHVKYRILRALSDGAETADMIWRAVRRYGVGYGTISPMLSYATKIGLVMHTGRRGHYLYRLTPEGLNYVLDTELRFKK